MKREQVVFVTIVFAQFCGTSLWFAGNAAFGTMIHEWPAGSLAYLIAAVQLGFISGTLFFAIQGIADRYSPSKIFFASCIAGAISNVLVLIQPHSLALAFGSRALTGFWLAGIYPVGMKIAADWQEKGLGNWLGALVGALVLGTALPYGLKLLPGFLDAQRLLLGVSALAIIGGLFMVLIVSDGPYRKQSQSFRFSALKEVFKIPDFRKPAFGYFGHMWELYALYAFLPFIIDRYKQYHPEFTANGSLLAFCFIAAGGVGCWAGGQLSIKLSSERIAFFALLISGLCCLFSPIVFFLPPWAFISMMTLWGFMVTADSPQFSTLVARQAPERIRGSAITLVTSIGFSITIISIQVLSLLHTRIPDLLFLVLVPGPLIGLASMYGLLKKR